MFDNGNAVYLDMNANDVVQPFISVDKADAIQFFNLDNSSKLDCNSYYGDDLMILMIWC